MRLGLCVAALLVSTSAFAQQVTPQSYTFTMSPDEANTMFNQLGKLEWTVINPLMNKLIIQLQAQNRAAATPSLPPQADPPKE